MTVLEYIAKFDELNLRCDVREDVDGRLSRFRTGIRPELQKELIPHRIATIEEMFEEVLELEKYIKYPTACRFDTRGFEQKLNPLSAKPNSGTGQPYRGPANYYPARNERGKGAPEGSRRPGQQQCYRCHEYGHYATECPTRNLLIEDAEVKDDPSATDYQIDFVPSDEDCEDPEDRVSVLRFSSIYQTKEEKAKMVPSEIPRMAVVRCALTLQEDEDWLRTTIFHAYVLQNQSLTVEVAQMWFLQIS